MMSQDILLQLAKEERRYLQVKKKIRKLFREKRNSFTEVPHLR